VGQEPSYGQIKFGAIIYRQLELMRCIILMVYTQSAGVSFAILLDEISSLLCYSIHSCLNVS
jgi:hypothetical protein